jgi:hypothetical protein
MALTTAARFPGEQADFPASRPPPPGSPQTAAVAAPPRRHRQSRLPRSPSSHPCSPENVVGSASSRRRGGAPGIQIIGAKARLGRIPCSSRSSRGLVLRVVGIAIFFSASGQNATPSVSSSSSLSSLTGSSLRAWRGPTWPSSESTGPEQCPP